MNNSGQVTIYAFMIAIVVIILALAFAFPVKQAADNARTNSTNSTAIGFDGTEGRVDTLGMNCSSTTDQFVKAGCLATDITPALFIGILLGLAGIIAGAKLVFGGTG